MLTTPIAIQPGTFCFQAFQSGDPLVFKQVFQCYYQQLCHYAYRIVLDYYKAEEIAADAFVKLYQQRENICDFQHIKRFLFTCTRNATCDTVRMRERYRRRLHQVALLQETVEPPCEQALIRSQTLDRLYQLARQLPGSCNRIFDLYFHQGYSTRQIAGELHMHPKTVRNQKAIGVHLLQQAARTS
jgi:RNA polymerase sigma-70 factor (ECF subfamily)